MSTYWRRPGEAVGDLVSLYALAVGRGGGGGVNIEGQGGVQGVAIGFVDESLRGSAEEFGRVQPSQREHQVYADEYSGFGWEGCAHY